ncbi:hypothetical protein TBC1_121073 [Lentimicrobium saccharophilum]|uniref:Uncharacterized protein n=1 Tax=Lentimicrobium saccharophilum TaxID=1678841 RepID=A0A0S7C5T6_9BACT|nr:hypothetical protein TBC1_121073 [Lentimicrobium saccharophilum]
MQQNGRQRKLKGFRGDLRVLCTGDGRKKPGFSAAVAGGGRSVEDVDPYRISDFGF